MKVKFISNNPHYYDRDPAHAAYAKKGEWCVINSAYFALRHWYNLHGQHSIEWQCPEIIATRSAESQLRDLVNDPPDVLALAVFIWNEHTQHWLAREFKKQHPDRTVIMGGPQLTAHRDPAFFHSFPYVDWAVYGDGERPFQQIIDQLCSPGSISEDDIRNAVCQQSSGYHCYPYEMLDDHQYLSSSMWIDQEAEILRVVESLESAGIPRSHLKFTVEFARGCMYNCTFCDWSQNLTNKVKRRRHDWKKEIELFHKLDIPIRETDANFGQWPEDLEIFEYANSLTRPDNNFYFIPKNTPKTKKSSIHYIMRRCFEVHGHRFAFQDWALQDPDTGVLEAVDRPSIPFSEVCEMVQELNNSVQDDIRDIHAAQLIIALAGQSLDSWCGSIQRIWNEASIKVLHAQHWELLPNSPGYRTEYKEKYKIQTTKAYMANFTHDVTAKSLDELYQQCATNITINHAYSSTNLVTSNSTMTFRESIAARKMITNIDMLTRLKKTPRYLLSDNDMSRLKNKSSKEAETILETIQPYIDKYGFMIMAKYNDGKIFPNTLPLMGWN